LFIIINYERRAEYNSCSIAVCVLFAVMTEVLCSDGTTSGQESSHELDSTETVLSGNTSECDPLKQETDVTMGQRKKHMEELDRENNALCDDRQSQTINEQKLKDERDSFRARLDDKSSECDRLKGEIDMTKAQLTRVTEERDQARRKLTSTQQELKHMKVMQVNNIELAVLKAERQHKDNSQAEVERLKTELRDESVKLARAETTVQFLKKEKMELREKIEGKKVEYEDREVLTSHVDSSKQQPSSSIEVSLGEYMK